MGGGGQIAASNRAAWIREHAGLLLLLLAAAVVSIVVHLTVYPAYSWNRDEPVYLWQVQGLLEGRFFQSGGGAPVFFQPWLSGLTDGQFFSQYTLGWPLVLAASQLVLGTPAAALVLATMLAVSGVYALARVVTADRTLAIVAAALLLVSPLFVVQSGVYLGYLFSLGLGTLWGAALLHGVRTGRRVALVAAGVSIGWLLMTRPFDAVMWAWPFSLYVLWVHRRELRRVVHAIAWGAVGVAPLLVATLLYNRSITGSFTQFPITAADPRDTFFFGEKGIMPNWPTTGFGLRLAVRGLGRNLWELPPFLSGSYLGVAAAAFGLWLRRRDRTTILIVFLLVAFPAGYFFFWGIFLSAAFARVSGPIYLIPMFAPLSILIATAILHVWSRRRDLAIAGVALLVVATVPFMVDRVRLNHNISEANVPWRDAPERITGRALVFVQYSGPYLLHLNPYSRNPPDLDGDRLLYAVDLGPANLDLIAARPGRDVWFEQSNLNREVTLADPELPVPRITVRRAEVVEGRTLRVRVEIVNPSADPTVMAFLQVGNELVTRTLSTTARAGDRYTTEFTVAADVPGAALRGSDVDAVVMERLGTIEVGMAHGGSPATALNERQELQTFSTRLDDGELELLTPGRTAEARPDPRRRHLGQMRAERVARTPALAVEVTPG